MQGKRRPRLTSLVVAGQATLGLLIAVTIGVHVIDLRASALADAKRSLISQALVLADQAERAFEAVDLVQTTLVETIRARGLNTPGELRRALGTEAVNRDLDAHVAALPQIELLGLVDADGAVINQSHEWPLRSGSVADRPYFTALQADPGKETVISDVFVARLTHAPALVISHRLSAPDGRFLGITMGGVPISYFERLYETVYNLDHVAIALTRTDGLLIARYPYPDKACPSLFVRQAITNLLNATGTASATLQHVSPVDGVERVVAGRRLAKYPMVVSAAADVRTVLAPWRKQTGYLVAVAVLLECVIGAVGILMLRQLRSHRLLAEARALASEELAARRGAETELALGRERDRLDSALQVQAARFGVALGAMTQALCIFDAADGLVVGNDRLAHILGLPSASIAPGMTILGLRDLAAETGGLLWSDIDSLHAVLDQLKSAGHNAARTFELTDGRTLEVNFAPMDGDGWLATLEDVTAQRKVEARIAYMAHHDALTGLANRTLFHARLAEAIARGERSAHCAVLYLDLDHFKAVNDTLGHPVGDALLCEVTQRLLREVRKVDTVARLGGDEFAIVLDNCAVPEDVTNLAKRLIDAIAEPYVFDGDEVVIGTSIGIALVPSDGKDPDAVLKAADLALYRSKSEGRGRFCFFEPAMNERMQARRTMELDLRRAISEGEFRMHYQPIINVASRTVSGFEALVRWYHRDRGMVSPADFIPLAEETGLIVPLGRWVMQQACADAATWPGALRVAVNLSPLQLNSRSLLEDIAAALASTGLPASRLELEITETAILEDSDAVLALLRQLRGMGARIALDDFGTGYSSLSYLRRFPFNKVKIDRSFISGLGKVKDCDTIVAAVIDLCDRLGMVTTSEGVETEAQLAKLAAFRSTEAQGYLFSRPLPANEVPELCRRLGRTPETVA